MPEPVPGPWYWEAPNLDQEQREPWDKVLSSDAIGDGDRLLDPVAPPSEIDDLADSRKPARRSVQARGSR